MAFAKRKRFFRRKPKMTLKKVNREVQRLKRAPELKFISAGGTNLNAYAANSLIEPLSGVGQGVTDQLRVGNWINVHSVRFRCDIYNTDTIPAAGSATKEAITRIVILWSKSYSASAPSVASIMSSDDVISTPNPEQRDVYVILYDKVKTMSLTGNTVVSYDRTIRFPRGHKVHYNGVNSTDYDHGHIFVIIMCDAASTKTATYYQYLTYYTDQ